MRVPTPYNHYAQEYSKMKVSRDEMMETYRRRGGPDRWKKIQLKDMFLTVIRHQMTEHKNRYK